MCSRLLYWQVKSSLSNEAACLNRLKFSFNFSANHRSVQKCHGLRTVDDQQHITCEWAECHSGRWRRWWCSYRLDDCWEGNQRLWECFNVCKRETSGYFSGDLRTVSSRVCGNESWMFLTDAVFVETRTAVKDINPCSHSSSSVCCMKWDFFTRNRDIYSKICGKIKQWVVTMFRSMFVVEILDVFDRDWRH